MRSETRFPLIQWVANKDGQQRCYLQVHSQYSSNLKDCFLVDLKNNQLTLTLHQSAIRWTLRILLERRTIGDLLVLTGTIEFYLTFLSKLYM